MWRTISRLRPFPVGGPSHRELRPSRVMANTRRVLDLFDLYQAKATFFFVGWVAERFPELVREVQSRGHELACHSYWHRTVYSLTLADLREDTRRAKLVIEDISGEAVNGYRSPAGQSPRIAYGRWTSWRKKDLPTTQASIPSTTILWVLPETGGFPIRMRAAMGLNDQGFPPATFAACSARTSPWPAADILRIFPSAYTELSVSESSKRRIASEWWCICIHGNLIRNSHGLDGPLKSRLSALYQPAWHARSQ